MSFVKVKSLRAVRLASLNGMCVHIPANETTDIPSVLLHEALSLGCIPAEESDVVSLRDAQVDADSNQIAREEYIAGGMQELVELNDIADFTPNGVPRIDALRTILDDQKVTSQERDQIWASRFQLAQI